MQLIEISVCTPEPEVIIQFHTICESSSYALGRVCTELFIRRKAKSCFEKYIMILY